MAQVQSELPVHDIPALSGNNAPVHDELVIDRLEVEGQVEHLQRQQDRGGCPRISPSPSGRPNRTISCTAAG